MENEQADLFAQPSESTEKVKEEPKKKKPPPTPEAEPTGRFWTADVERLINGDPLEIPFKYPLDDPPGTTRWYLRQPSDWLYDQANAVREARHAETLELPEMERARNMPPSTTWVADQEAARKDAEGQIEALEAKKSLTPEEQFDLENLKLFLPTITNTEGKSRADEYAARASTRAFDVFLLRRLVIDDDGHRLFDPETKEGESRWNRLGRNSKAELRKPLYQVLLLIQKAANFPEARPSS